VPAFSRRDFLRYQAAAGVALLAPAAVRPLIEPKVRRTKLDRSAIRNITNGSGPTFNVTQFGAFPNGMDATAGFQRCINAAQAANAGATVVIPAGTYAFKTRVFGAPAASIQVHQLGSPITISGAGAGETVLVQHVTAQDLMSVRTDGTVVEGITFDCQSFQGGSCFGVGTVANPNGPPLGGNYTTLQDCTALGSEGYKAFTLYYAGPVGASEDSLIYNVGNQVLNCTINDQISDDGFSFSFQQNALVENITHFGSRMAIFMCDDIQVKDYDYTMNPFCNQPGSPQGYVTNGFWITPPSSEIQITNFTTSGEGGIISGPVQERQAENITITNHQFTGDGYALQIGNVAGLTITGSNFGTTNQILFNPGTPGKKWGPGSVDGVSPNGVYGATNVLVENSTVPQIQVQTDLSNNGTNTQGFGPPVVQATFTDCTFPELTLNGSANSTFSISPRQDSSVSGPTSFTVNGGVFSNQLGGFYSPPTLSTVQACTVAPSATGTTVTLTLAENESSAGTNSLSIGQQVTIAGIEGFNPNPLNGTKTITAISGQNIQYVLAPNNTPGGSYTKGGIVTAATWPTTYAVSSGSVASDGQTVSLVLTIPANSTLHTLGITSAAQIFVEGVAGGVTDGVYTLTHPAYGENTGTIGKTLVFLSPTQLSPGRFNAGGTITCSPSVFDISGLSLPPVCNFPPYISPISLQGTAPVGQQLTASTGNWFDTQGSGTTYTYQWNRNNVAISGQTASTYTTVGADNGNAISVTVTAANVATGSSSATSNPITIT
jgi:hypothetical protein